MKCDTPGVENDSTKKWADLELSRSVGDEINNLLGLNYQLMRFEDICKALGANSEEEQEAILRFLIKESKEWRSNRWYDRYMVFWPECHVDQYNAISGEREESMWKFRRRLYSRCIQRENNSIRSSDNLNDRIPDRPAELIDDSWKHDLLIGPDSPARDLLASLRYCGEGEMDWLAQQSYYDHVLVGNRDYYEKMVKCMKDYDFIEEVAGLDGERILRCKTHRILE